MLKTLHKKAIAILATAVLILSGVQYAIGAVAYDTATANNQAFGGGSSWSHTVTGASPYLIVCSISRNNQPISGVTYNSVPMTNLLVTTNAGWTTGTARFELWGLANPSTGANTVSVTYTGANNMMTGAISFTGVSSIGATSTAASNSVSLTTVIDNAYLGGCFGSDSGTLTAGANTNIRASGSNGGGSSNWIHMVDSTTTKSPAGSYSLVTTGGSVPVAMGVVLNPPATVATPVSQWSDF